MPVEASESSCYRGVRNHGRNGQDWHRNARPLEDQAVPLPSAVVIWDKVLKIIKLVFVDGMIPRAFSHGIMVLIPKDKPGEYRGNALLEIIT